MANNAAKPGAAVRPRPRQDVRRPPMFRVLLHNDHYTTMDFVVEILKTVFDKSTFDAVRIMLNVHQKGIGVCGVFASEIAETKINEVHRRAREYGFPLRCSMEPE